MFRSNCFTFKLDDRNFEEKVPVPVSQYMSTVMVGTLTVMSEVVIEVVRCMKRSGFWFYRFTTALIVGNGRKMNESLIPKCCKKNIAIRFRVLEEKI